MIQNGIQCGDKGKIKINAQVVRMHSPKIRNGTTQGQKYAIATNKNITM